MDDETGERDSGGSGGEGSAAASLPSSITQEEQHLPPPNAASMGIAVATDSAASALASAVTKPPSVVHKSEPVEEPKAPSQAKMSESDDPTAKDDGAAKKSPAKKTLLSVGVLALALATFFFLVSGAGECEEIKWRGVAARIANESDCECGPGNPLSNWALEDGRLQDFLHTFHSFNEHQLKPNTTNHTVCHHWRAVGAQTWLLKVQFGVVALQPLIWVRCVVSLFIFFFLGDAWSRVCAADLWTGLALGAVELGAMLPQGFLVRGYGLQAGLCDFVRLYDAGLEDCGGWGGWNRSWEGALVTGCLTGSLLLLEPVLGVKAELSGDASPSPRGDAPAHRSLRGRKARPYKARAAVQRNRGSVASSLGVPSVDEGHSLDSRPTSSSMDSVLAALARRKRTPANSAITSSTVATASPPV